MKQFYQLLLISAVLSLSSCTSTMKFLYGIKSPKAETPESVKEYLSKHKMDTTRVAYFKDFKSYLTAQQMGEISIPSAIFFNKAGKRVSYTESTDKCPANVDKFIAGLSNFENASVIEDDGEFSSLVTFAGSEIPQEINVYILWTTYGGRLTKSVAFSWAKLLKQAKAQGFEINYYLLNADILYSWKDEIEELNKNQG